MEATPAELENIRRLARGDDTALAALYDRFGQPIYSLVFRMVGNGADTEEIVQDVFVSLWKNAHTFDDKRSSPFTWLVSIARNKAIDRIRRSRRRLPEVSTRTEQPAPDPVDPAPNATTNNIDRERAEIVVSWIAELPPNQRDAIALAFFEGLTHPEIATRLNESIGTVKSRIRLGMEKLRTKLERTPL